MGILHNAGLKQTRRMAKGDAVAIVEVGSAVEAKFVDEGYEDAAAPEPEPAPEAETQGSEEVEAPAASPGRPGRRARG